ncbi:DNA-invertase hin [Sphingomonas antarctica]|uniref:recombinase family protein n=1 Tax=Sphingomonas antarctica TaxID=2040274 RepID=UPI0039ED35BE
MKTVRCAIYTRKSSEEGLEQSFNSLDAQRESCAAYILSQASEGWTALPDIYDDGGLSGGTLERPALQRLLAEVAAGRIDIIVVYKVDRLTRSLLDFSRLVEAFDKAGTSFVSVTQSFNTTTSMGRLTLNMLLSFAQFEREVTAERIRDKIAASKAKGMWMGGTPPLGYEPDGRTLKVVEPHAVIVRNIFQRYLKLGNVRLVAEGLVRDGTRAPQRHTVTGRLIGGGPLSRGQLYTLLKNEMYIGIIAHNGQRYPALHLPIIDADTWEQTQAKLADNLQGHRTGARAKSPSLLAGKVVDAAGEPLVSVHATKPGKSLRYRYYVSRALHDMTSKEGSRIPARELEAVVAERLAKAFDDPLELLTAANLSFHMDQLIQIDQRAREVANALRQRGHAAAAPLVTQVRIEDHGIVIACSTETLCETLGVMCPADAPSKIELVAEVRLTRSGRAMRLIDSDGRATGAVPSRPLLGLLIQASAYWAELRKGELNITALAEREGVLDSYITRLLRLAFLSPEIIEAAVSGTQPASLSSSKVMLGFELNPSWTAQRDLLLN